jgi:hypothetical protein
MARMSNWSRLGQWVGCVVVATMVSAVGMIAIDVGAPGHAASAPSVSTTTFTSAQAGAYLLPSGYSFLRVLVVGGQGGGGVFQGGGRGAAVTAEIPYSAIPQGVLYVSAGAYGGYGLSYVGNGYLTGGAGGSAASGPGPQGGAASGIYTNCAGAGICSTPVVVAGGGGGKGPDKNYTPADAGMPGGTGNSGWSNLVDPGPTGGGGGTQSAPGEGGSCCIDLLGNLTLDTRVSGVAGGGAGGGLSSNGGAGGQSVAASYAIGGGGGGGGYYPGGGGAGRVTEGSFTFEGAGGGGGSSYLSPSATLIGAHPADLTFQTGDERHDPTPRVEITPFNAHSSVAVQCAQPARYAGGTPILCTATVTGAGYGTPTGTVTFSSLRVANGITPPTCTLDATGSCTVTFNTPEGKAPPPGYDINAQYPGDVNYLFSDGLRYLVTDLEFLGPFTMNCMPATPTVGQAVACHLDVQEFHGQYSTPFAEQADLSVSGGTGTFSPSTCTFSVVAYYEGTCDTTFTPTSAGTLTVLATALTTATATAALSVSSAVPTLTAVDVAPSTAHLAKGTTQQLSATARYSDGSTHDLTTTATWSSDNAAVTVDATGLATATAIGGANVTASFGGQSGTAAVDVTPPVLTVIDVTPATAEVVIGATQPFQATGHYTDGTTANITLSVAWSTDAPAHLSVGANGVATGVSAGSSPVVATLLGTTASASLTVDRDTPSITWPNPAAITYGTALGATQLNATATYNGQPVAGTFTYPLAVGTILHGGSSQTLSAVFTPNDSATFTDATAVATIDVNPATPAITWANPADITYGTALGAAQLNATSSTPGTFTYTPAAGTVLDVGATQTLTATFTPATGADFSTATWAATINVGKATPTITWPPPAPIVLGTFLGTTQLSATASVPGTFTYSPSKGTLPGVGSHTLSATFVPADSTHFANASATRTINVLYSGTGTSCLGAPGHAILAPINADGSSRFKAGSTVALQFRVCDAWGFPIIAPRVVTGVALGSTSVANNFRFDFFKLAWVMPLSTKGLASGRQYTGVISLDDGTTIPFTFTLR